MDTQAVAEAAGVGVGTLNVWIQRRLIPGVTVGSRGRVSQPRDFDLDTAVHIAIMSELIRVGLTAPAASAIAEQRAQYRNKFLGLISSFALPAGHVIYDQNAWEILQKHMRRAPAPIWFNSEAELPTLFESLRMVPAVYTIINLAVIVDRMREANDRWEQERKA
jgi:hypothetical protein